MGKYNLIISWKSVFLFCLGITITGFLIMHWIESDLIYQQKQVSILGLELWYSKEKIMTIFSGMDPELKMLLRYHLRVDFLFMAGCFPGIACLCVMAAKRLRNSSFRKFLFILAGLQSVAWIFDIAENIYLLAWLENPEIGSEFRLYHVFVYSKWILASAGFWISVFVMGKARFRKKPDSSASSL